MGAGGSIQTSTQYQIERSKPIDGSDLTDYTSEEIRDELIRIRILLHKYVEKDASDLDLNDVQAEVNDNGSTMKEACVVHILHFRQMLRKQTLHNARRNKELRRRLSVQGQHLARMALQGITPEVVGSDTDSEDGLEDMPRK
tara:strand:+ start:142 stop:567 length:426 start_codon:yes stop_codon:yes gene_type:complete